MALDVAQLFAAPVSGRLGGVKQGSGISIAVDGTISATGGGGGGAFAYDNTTNIFSCAITSLANRTTATENFLAGALAGCSLTTGSDNIFLGSNAGRLVTSGCYNILMGCNAGDSITTSCNNIIIGNNAGCSITDQLNNYIFIGRRAGANFSCGQRILAIGTYSGECKISGSDSVFLGNRTGRQNVTGFGNTFIGSQAGSCGCIGSGNTFLGAYSGFNLGCAPIDPSYDPSGNTFVGHRVGQQLAAGNGNTFIGHCINVSGSIGGYLTQNTFLGTRAGRSLDTGDFSVGIGANALTNFATGCNNIAIGAYSGSTGLTLNGIVNIINASNRIVLGNTAHTCAQIQIGWTVNSDIRDKCILGPVPHGKGFLQSLNPIEFAFKDRETGALHDVDKTRYGFSAQEIAALEGNHPVVVSTDNPEKLQFTADHLLPIIVNAVKEIADEVEKLKGDTGSIQEKLKQISQALNLA